MIIVLFGPPGVGKSYLGNLLHTHLNIRFLDTDDLYSDEEIQMIREKRFNDEAKEIFRAKVVDTINAMSVRSDETVVIAGAYTTDRSRVQMIKHFIPNIRFVRVEADRKTGMKRALERLHNGNHIITEEVLERQWNLFEEPSFSYSYINNENKSDDELIQQFSTLL